MKVISIVNQKGGVGKSTIACNLAVAASHDNKQVLIIDADTQGSSLSFRSLRETSDIATVSMPSSSIHKDIKNFSNFDLIIIDSGGRDNNIFRSSILASAGKGILLVPVLPSPYDIWATETTFEIIEEIKMTHDIECYTFFNQNIARTNISKEAQEALKDVSSDTDIKILKTILNQRVDYKNSISEGLGVIEYAPKSKAALEIDTLYTELKSILEGGCC